MHNSSISISITAQADMTT